MARIGKAVTPPSFVIGNVAMSLKLREVTEALLL